MQRRKKAGKPAPALENMPEIFDDLLYVWDAFWRLHRRRQIGMDICPLGVCDIMEYAKVFKVPRPRDFFEYISAMDNEFLSWYGDTKSSN